MTSSLLTSSTLLVWKSLESYGCDSRALFKQAGLDPDALYDPNSRYRYQSVRRLWALAIRATQDPCFGLKAARHWHPTSLHALGYALMASASLKDALDRAIRYFRIITTDPEELNLEETDECFKFTIDATRVKYRATAEEYDFFVALIVVLCRIMYGENFNPIRVALEREAPSCEHEFKEFFRSPVDFSAPRNTLVLDKQALTMALPTANAELVRTNDKIVTEYLAHLDRTNITLQVRAKLIERLPSGVPSGDTIARTLNVSPRTFQRKLKDEGTTYQQLLNETRRELAAQYIRNSRLSVVEITYLLGFSEPSNFSRAFKRWQRVSPTAYRQSIRETTEIRP